MEADEVEDVWMYGEGGVGVDICQGNRVPSTLKES